MQLCGFDVGLTRPLFLIAGPCVIESREMAIDIAGTLKEITAELGMPFIFKASYDKANRSSGTSFRGLGRARGLAILAEVKAQVGVPVLTDIHDIPEIEEVAAVVDVLQTPAFLCRQTDFIHAAASAGRPVNIKKGQFLSPWEMKNVVDKARAAALSARPHDPAAAHNIMVCERGASFGYITASVRHALTGGDARDRLPGGVRRYPFGSAARGIKRPLRWPARIRAGIGARGGGRRGRRCVHGNPSGSRTSLVRRSQCLALEAHAWVA